MNTLKRKMRKSSNRKGFTLIELIVVIVIIGILAAIAIPSLGGFQATAKFKADVATAKTIATAAQTAMANGKTLEDGTIVGQIDLLSYLSGGIAPVPARGTDFNFDIQITGSTLDSVRVAKGTTIIDMWPTPDTDTPASLGY